MPGKTYAAIGAIAAIVITCIFKDIDGVVVSTGIGLIAGLAGYAVGKAKPP